MLFSLSSVNPRCISARPAYVPALMLPWRRPAGAQRILEPPLRQGSGRLPRGRVQARRAELHRLERQALLSRGRVLAIEQTLWGAVQRSNLGGGGPKGCA
jgi:hypothetical protein